MAKTLTRLGVLVCVFTLVLAMVGCRRPADDNSLLHQVMPNGVGFEEVDISGFPLPSTVVAAYKETTGWGYVLELYTTGYASGLNLLCGVSAEGSVTNVICLSSNETLGKEKVYGEFFCGVTANTIGDVDTINGATYTTAAYKNAVRDALNAAAVLRGDTVNIGGSTTTTFDDYPYNDATLNWGAIQILEGGAKSW